jgi:hypothetical protein
MVPPELNNWQQSEAFMSGSPTRARRIQTAAQALGLGVFYLGMLTLLIYTIYGALESGTL